MNTVLWSIRHIKSALRYIKLGRENPELLKFDPSGLKLMKEYYSGVGEIVEKGRQSKLDNIGLGEGTDKASIRMSKAQGLIIGHDYLRYYDLLFQSLIDEKFTLLEFGCLRGQSLRMWKEYFSCAQIVGVDLDEATKKNEEERIDIYIGNATAQSTCEYLSNKYDNIKIIIDDASHAWGDQRKSLELFWPKLNRGGYYVVEDLECGSMGAFPEYPPENIDARPFWDYIVDRIRILQWPIDRNPKQQREQFFNYPEYIRQFEESIDMAIFVPGIIILRKK